LTPEIAVMQSTPRIDKLHRTLSGGTIDVVYVVRGEDADARAAWIAGEEFVRRPQESIDALVDRALRDYRAAHPPRDPVSALIVDCTR
jgi:hypothetical protein